MWLTSDVPKDPWDADDLAAFGGAAPGDPDVPSRRPPGWRWAVATGAIAARVGALATLYFTGASGSIQPSTPADVPVVADTDVAVTAPPAPVAETDQPGAGAPASSRVDPPAVPVANQAAPVRTGALTVRSVPPGALLTIDGRLAGETPVTVSDLPFGSHTIQVARPGFVPYQDVVVLSERAPSRVVSFSLQPGVPAVGRQAGAVFVDSRPRGARVFIDGRVVGTTPVRVPELSIGSHQVRIELGGYRPVSTPVAVTAGEDGRLAVTLERRDPATGTTPGRRR
jgi:hypothetical protein